jgi:hypothetical protein
MNNLSLGISGWLLVGTLSLLLGPVVIAFIALLAVFAIPVIIFAFIVKVFVLVFRA